MYFITVCSEIQRYEKKTQYSKLKLAKIKFFDNIIVINHQLLKHY